MRSSASSGSRCRFTHALEAVAFALGPPPLGECVDRSIARASKARRSSLSTTHWGLSASPVRDSHCPCRPPWHPGCIPDTLPPTNRAVEHGIGRAPMAALLSLFLRAAPSLAPPLDIPHRPQVRLQSRTHLSSLSASYSSPLSSRSAYIFACSLDTRRGNTGGGERDPLAPQYHPHSPTSRLALADSLPFRRQGARRTQHKYTPHIHGRRLERTPPQTRAVMVPTAAPRPDIPHTYKCTRPSPRVVSPPPHCSQTPHLSIQDTHRASAALLTHNTPKTHPLKRKCWLPTRPPLLTPALPSTLIPRSLHSHSILTPFSLPLTRPNRVRAKRHQVARDMNMVHTLCASLSHDPTRNERLTRFACAE